MEPYTPFQQIVLEHASRYPWWVASDLYKLIYQAAMGSRHAVPDREEARSRLEVEIANLREGPDEALLDPIAPRGVIVRVHLRPLLQKGLATEDLLEAFLHTANAFRGEERALRSYMIQSIELADHSLIHIRLHDLTRYLGLMSSAGFPAVHHSEEFNRVYHPAYRVVARQYLPKEWLKFEG